jgi:hypothetical protein
MLRIGCHQKFSAEGFYYQVQKFEWLVCTFCYRFQTFIPFSSLPLIRSRRSIRLQRSFLIRSTPKGQVICRAWGGMGVLLGVQYFIALNRISL